MVALARVPSAGICTPWIARPALRLWHKYSTRVGAPAPTLGRVSTPEQSTAGGTAARWTGLARGLAGSCHPGPVVAVTTLTTALAVTAGQSTTRCLQTAAAVLVGQLSIGWCNDAVDALRDADAKRHGKPIVSGMVSTRQVWAAAYTALALCVPLSLACGLWAGAVHLAGVAAAWAYDLHLKSTAWSWAPYAVGFAALPTFVALGLPDRPWPAWWVVTAGALLGIGAHLGNVLPDIGGDVAAGVRGWPQRLGRGCVRLLLPVPLVIASAVLTLGPDGPVDRWEMTALALAGTLAATSSVLGHRWERAAFAGAVAVAVVDVSALLLLHGTGIT